MSNVVENTIIGALHAESGSDCFGPIFALSLSLSLSLRLYIFTVMRAVLAVFCQGCFCRFSKMTTGGFLTTVSSLLDVHQKMSLAYNNKE